LTKFGPQRSTAAGSTEHHWLAHGKNVWHFFYDGAGNIKVEKSVDQTYSFAAAVTIDATVGNNDVMLNEPACYDAVTDRIHILYGRSIDNAGAPPVLCHKFSSDGGATWSAEHIIDNGGTRGNNRFYRVGITAFNGVVFIVHTSESNSTFTTDGFVWFSRSTDGGATWSAIAKMFTSGTVNPAEPNSYMGPNGALHISWYDPGVAINEGGDIYYVRSADSGVTLPGAPTRLTTGAVFGRTRVFGSNGKINIVGNSNWSVGGIADVSTLRSDDDGASWSAPAVQAVHGASDLDHPWGEMDSLLGAIIYVDFATNPRTYGLLLTADGGATWSAGPTPLTTTGNSDAPQLVITDDLLIATGMDNVANTFIRRMYPLFSPAIPSTPILDAFTRANEDPLSDGGKWTVPGGIAGADNAKLVGNQAVRRLGAAAFDRAGAWRNDVVYTTAAEAYLTIANSGGADGEVDVILLDEPTNKNGYWFGATGGGFTNSHNLEKITAAAGAVLQSDAVAIATGDKHLLRVTPSDVAAYRHDGVDWFELFRAADTAFRAGLRAEFNIVGNTTGGQAIDDFGGGPLVVPSNTGAPNAVGTVGVGQVLSSSNGTYAAANGATPTRFRYQWQSSPDGSVWTNIAGAVLPFFTVANAALQHRCVVTAINSIGSIATNSNVLVPGSGQSLLKRIVRQKHRLLK
jgi:hypothetical protein